MELSRNKVEVSARQSSMSRLTIFALSDTVPVSEMTTRCGLTNIDGFQASVAGVRMRPVRALWPRTTDTWKQNLEKR